MGHFKVVVSDQVFPTVDVEKALLAEIDADLTLAEGDVNAVLAEASDADAILNTYLPWDAAAIGRLEKCRIIARYGIGVDNVDLEAARRAGIVVTNVPDYSVEEVGIHPLALLLAVLRKMVPANEKVRQGAWGIGEFRPIRRLSELTAALLGYGRIERQLAAGVQAMGGRVVVHDPYLAPTSDSLSWLSSPICWSGPISSHSTPLSPHRPEASSTPMP